MSEMIQASHMPHMHMPNMQAITSEDNIIKDEQTLNIKHKLMERMKWSALLTSIADTCKFVAGPMFGIGIGAAISAGSVMGALPLTLLAVAMTLLVGGVASGYASSRVWQGSNFDNLELNARSTARHLVQELRTNSMCLTQEHEQNTRADGKTWAQVVSPPTQQPQPRL